jgi:hypothetical protein
MKNIKAVKTSKYDAFYFTDSSSRLMALPHDKTDQRETSKNKHRWKNE